MNDLLILQVALERGIYVKDEYGIRFVDQSHLIYASGSLRLVREVLVGHYEVLQSFDIGDYKRVWSLQKEDLYA